MKTWIAFGAGVLVGLISAPAKGAVTRRRVAESAGQWAQKIDQVVEYACGVWVDKNPKKILRKAARVQEKIETEF